MTIVASLQSVLYADTNYFLELDQGNTNVIYSGTAMDKLRPLEAVSMRINDIRDFDEKFQLAVHGFAFMPHKSAESKFDDKEKITRTVYEEAKELLKKEQV